MSMQLLVALAAEATGADPTLVLSRRRTQREVIARYFLNNFLLSLGLTQAEVGRLVGGRDHSTIRFSRDNFAGLLRFPQHRQQWERFLELTQAHGPWSLQKVLPPSPPPAIPPGIRRALTPPLGCTDIAFGVVCERGTPPRLVPARGLFLDRRLTLGPLE